MMLRKLILGEKAKMFKGLKSWGQMWTLFQILSMVRDGVK